MAERAQAVVQHVETAQPPAVMDETAALISMIERCAMNSAVDIDKMERLLVMQERVVERRARTAFAAALAEMQPDLPVVTERGRIEVPAKDGRAGHSTPFARWEDINQAIRPILAAHGFALSFRVGTAADGKITVTGILSHREGHQEETTITLMHDSSGSKNPVQAVGSSTSYGKRYTAMALLNITTGGEDDDGHAAGQSAATERAIVDINGCEGLDALRAWKAKHYDGLSKVLTAPELKQVVELYNRRVKAAKGDDQ